MKIITVSGRKGGLGKSTTSINITISLEDIGKKVMLIDSDDLRQSTKFGLARKKDMNIQRITTINELSSILEGESEKNTLDYVIIDLPSGDSAFNNEAMNYADLIIIPVTDSSNDYTEVLDTVVNIRETIFENNDYTKLKILASRVKWNSVKFHQELCSEYENIERVSVFSTQMIEHSTYKEMIINGLSPYESSNNYRVKKSISDLVREIEYEK